MSFLHFILLIAFLVLIVALIVAFRRYRSRLPLLPTNQRQYNSGTQSRFYNPTVEVRNRIPHSIPSSKSRSGSLAAPNVFSTIHPQQSPRKPPPPFLSPLPVAVRKPEQYSFSRDDLPVDLIELVNRPVTKVSGEKTVEPPIEPAYRTLPELPFYARKPPQYSPPRNDLPGPLIENIYRPAAKSLVQNNGEPCIKPPPFQSFESQGQGTVVDEGGEDDDDIKDLDHPKLRKLANQEMENMKKCRGEEKLAKRSRQFILARELVVKAQRHEKRMRGLNERASELIFAKNNKDSTLRKIDLHGLTVKEAIGHTNRVLKEARELGNSEIRIIVGKGKHSKDGLAKLKPAIQAFLEENRFPVEVDPRNDGVFVVGLDSALGS